MAGKITRKIGLAAAGAALGIAGPLAAQERTIAPAHLTGPLAGTLLPAAGQIDIADAPAMLIIAGSGPTDRDGNSPLGVEASSYRLLAEALQARGITTLRTDKRGMFASAGAVADPNDVTIADYVADTKAWAADLREVTGQDCVWLAGHSEGGIVALATAADTVEGLCGLVLLASPGRPVGQILREQLRANPANAPILPQADAAIAALEKGEPVDAAALHPGLQPLFAPQVQGFVMSLMAQNPAKLLQQTELPVLVVHGVEDMQVAEADVAALEQARPDLTVLRLDGVNHVLKVVPPGDRAANMAAYADAEAPLAPQIAPAIADFVASN
ncbi:alpha/beta fold hydrolase [Altererythrobacter sp. SALINAS58]|uniref:alpha/beta hydrolase n=1 Tax=Alteripontixanthobacter muriae TaxID=2705546 RepID=UPI0015768ABE|nr:alpha/beta fold hydrolase [Alteripontixanthobacter muriae]NTZ42733.1 alpha/beta fold hydrolase [Alteripontixanthobacter muriae]